jgi:hypothetical protein
MGRSLIVGQMVTVKAFGSRLLRRTVVGFTPTTVIVCKDEEYQRSIRERRSPVCVGFPLDDIRDDDATRAGATTQNSETA